MANTIAISVLAETAGARRGIDQLNDRLDKTGGVIKKLAVGAAVFKGGQMLAGSFREAIGAVREQDKLLGQSKAVIKSTGGAANITAAQVVKLSEAMEAKSTVDAEVIQNGANVLLTFTKVRNEAGKGNDVFNQGTQAALDMSAALGTSMQGAATLVGKALNDPIKGVAALGRSGVQFTAQQKKVIASLVQSGDTLGAQKIILKELNTQFAGSAGADKMGVRIKRLKDTFDGWIEAGVRKGMPVVEKLITVLDAKLPVAIDKVNAGINAVRPAFTGAFNAIQPVLSFLAGNVEVVATFVGVIATVVTVVKAWTIAQGLLNAVLMLNPISLIVVAIAGLAAGLVYAYEHSEKFRTIVQTAFSVVKTAANVAWNVIKTAAAGIARAFGAARTAASQMASAVSTAAGKVRSTIGTIKDKILAAVKNFPTLLVNAGKELINGLIKGITSKIADVGHTMGKVAGKIKGFLPGSPVKEGPLTSWNNGGAGKRLIDQGIIAGVEARRTAVARTMSTTLNLDYSSGKTKTNSAPTGYLAPASGGNTVHHTYQITVVVTDTMSPAEQGRKFARAIQEFERTQGRGR